MKHNRPTSLNKLGFSRSYQNLRGWLTQSFIEEFELIRYGEKGELLPAIEKDEIRRLFKNLSFIEFVTDNDKNEVFELLFPVIQSLHKMEVQISKMKIEGDIDPHTICKVDFDNFIEFSDFSTHCVPTLYQRALEGFMELTNVLAFKREMDKKYWPEGK